MKHWHLLMTKPREDDRAESHLLNQGYVIFRPLIRQYKLRKGKQVAITEPLFPRYIFIQLDDVASNWSRIRSTRGVSGLVRFAEMPAKIPNTLISLIKKQCDETNILDTTVSRPFVFQSGDEVEITEGSFKGVQAIIREQKGQERVILLLTLLGKEQAVELPINQIKSIR